MPTIEVHLLKGRNRDQKREIAQVFAREMARIAKCEEAGVHVIFNEVERENWAVGGVLVDEK
jgi:4-oxalocrotonate tautomerase